MSRYICAEPLREKIDRWAEHTEYYTETELNIMRCVIDQIDSAPSIYIVHCGECKRAEHEPSGVRCGLSDVLMGAEGFCSIGERSSK